MKDIDLKDFEVLTNASRTIASLWGDDDVDPAAAVEVAREATVKLATLYRDTADRLHIRNDDTHDLTGQLIYYRDNWVLWRDAGNLWREKVLSTQEVVGARLAEIDKEARNDDPDNIVEINYFLVRRTGPLESERINSGSRNNDSYGPSITFSSHLQTIEWKKVGTALKNAKAYAKDRHGEVEVWARVHWDGGRLRNADRHAAELGALPSKIKHRQVNSLGRLHWELAGARFVTAINHIKEI